MPWKAKKQLDDSEAQNIALTNEIYELRERNRQLENERYQEKAALAKRVSLYESRIKKLETEVCEWRCLICTAEYYGRSAVEVGRFKCLTKECDGAYCVPAKFVGDADQSITEAIELAHEIEDSAREIEVAAKGIEDAATIPIKKAA